MRKTLANFFIFSGISILLISSFFLWKRNDPSRLQFDNVKLHEREIDNSDSHPLALVIDDLAIRLPIIPANKNGINWETTSEGVSYLASSPRPGDLGNSIMYGHNWGSILGGLYRARPGHKIEIIYSNGVSRQFEIQYVQETTPDDASVLAETTDRRITLYTCSGIFDQKRLVVTATLVETLSSEL